ncbi:TPA: hypothetical protein L1D66_003714 [Escherichia coli]|nr:hypothetical protein [Escherichia coli]
MSINIDGRDCCQTGQPSQDVIDGALTKEEMTWRDEMDIKRILKTKEELNNMRKFLDEKGEQGK